MTMGPRVVEELPVHIELNGRRIVTLMASRTDLEELALGWLYAEHLIDSPDDILGFWVCGRGEIVEVFTHDDRTSVRSPWRQIVTSGCASGGPEAEELWALLPQVTADPGIDWQTLGELMRALLALADQHSDIGGVHSAALANREGIVAYAEDVGRHNAVDKVIGRGLLQRASFSQLALLTTGRISSEMAYKAARSSIGLAASLTVPTTLAIEIAERAGITLVGRAGGPRRHAFTHPHRLASQVEQPQLA
jgi:FdhD protein